MRRRGRAIACGCAALAAALLLAATAGAATKPRWRLVSASETPRSYYQGIAAGRRNVFFVGTHGALFKTSFQLDDRRAGPREVPKAASTGDGYNHAGDLGWIRRGRARLLVPLECFQPHAPGGGNTCGRGAIAVADARTLDWLHVARLSPDEIDKAMWAEPSPDGRLVWTSVGRDLLAYSAAGVLAPADPDAELHPVVGLAGVSPMTKVTGATFVGERLFVAGRRGKRVQVWSIDLTKRTRRLEIDRVADGESEGLAAFDGAGGTLHWQVQPFKRRGARGRVLNYEPARP